MRGRLGRLLWACALCGSLSAKAADWPFHRQNFRGDGNPGEPLTAAQAQTFKQKWVFSDNGLNYANPIVVGQTVYVTSGDGNLYAIDTTNGARRWAMRSSIIGPFQCLPQAQSKGPIGSPAVVGSDVFMPGADGLVYDYDAATGRIKWKTQIADVLNNGEFLWNSGFPLHGKVYFGVSALIDCLMPPGRVVALDQATGAVVGTWWGGGPNHQPGAGVWDQPAYDPATNKMFLTTGTIANGLSQSQEPWADAFVAINPDTMQTVDSFAPINASFSADFDFGAGPTLYDTADGRHFVAATNKNGYVYALNRDHLAGGVLWTYQISGPGVSPDIGESSIVPAAFANGLLFVGGAKTRDGHSGAVAALDGATGRAQWLFNPQGFLIAGIIATGDVVIFGTTVPGTFAGHIYVLSQQTGAMLFHQQMGAVMGAPTYANGQLYVPDLTGKLFAFAADGAGGPPPPPPPPPGSAFSDDFNRAAGPLGPNWFVAHGAFSDTGATATGTAPQSYAFWTGTPQPDAPIAADVALNSGTYVGVTARAKTASPDSDHYAAYVGPDGTIGLARRDANTYTYLGFGPKFPAGFHRLELTAFGASPVSLSVKLDGAEVIHATDSSAGALTITGFAGIFDYNGAGQAIDNFSVGGNLPPPTQSKLTLTFAGTGGGRVTSSPAGIDCTANCSASFNTGTGVTLTAAPDGTSLFAGWSGACSGTGACTIAMNSDQAVTATVNAKPPPGNRVLTVTQAGAGGGHVVSSPAGIDCAPSCSAQFTQGTSVTLTATPDASSTFAGWSGACSGTSTCTLVMSADQSATATFQPTAPPPKKTLTVTVAGPGTGHVTSSPAGISCAPTCTAQFAQGTSVALTAAPDATSTFVGWSGACSGMGTCTVAMSADQSATATFQPNGSLIIAADEFTTSGSLTGWKVWRGGFSVSGGAAQCTASRSYATKGSAVSGDVTVSATVIPGGGMSYFGVIGRAKPSEGSQDHYAAWETADGNVHLGRANSWSYTYLQDAPTKLSGPHKLTLKVQGTGPVHLSVFVDDQPVLDVVDSSAQALKGSGLEGIFSWQGAGPAFQHFLATQP